MRALLLFVGVLAVGSGCNDPNKGKVAATVGSAVAITEAGPAPASVDAGAASATARYTVTDATSKIGFVGSKVTGKHEGSFGKFTGTIEIPGGKIENGKVTVTIDTSTLKTDDEELDEHLKSKDFFDVAKFPKATFTSTSITTRGDAAGAPGSTHTLTGNLELHGVTRSIGVPATIKIEGGVVTATSEFTINRKDFGIVYPGKKDDLIKDGVLVTLTLKGQPAA
jgi:polyisoprenoid-binding protein YceI